MILNVSQPHGSDNKAHFCFLVQVLGLHATVTMQEVNSLLLSGKIFKKQTSEGTTIQFYLQK